MSKNKFPDVFGPNPKTDKMTMQVIIFDKKFQCLYRLHNIPAEWNFKQVAEAMKFTGDLKDYNAFRLVENAELCIDDYRYTGKEMILTASNCS